MGSDGDGWTVCAAGHQHWGRHGAAGLLLLAHDGGTPRVLLQHRAAWSHHGDTWGIPGGARGLHESPVAAAVREAAEETGLDPLAVTPGALYVDDHGGWAYTTVLARASSLLDVHAEDRESTAVAWVAVDQVAEHPLHPGFARTWPRVRGLLLALPAAPTAAATAAGEPPAR